MDSSVWIDFYNGVRTAQTDNLDGLLGSEELVMGDLILTEVLQGFRRDRDFETARKALAALPVIELGGEEIAIEAAKNLRRLRKIGITVRKTIDCIIATRCIVSGHDLLHSDRDFDPFRDHLGLRVL